MARGGLVLCSVYTDASLIRNSPPPQDYHRTIGIVLLQGPTKGVLLVSEVPLCTQEVIHLKLADAPLPRISGKLFTLI